ncbi:hypothetical protein A6A19_08825 [Actinobacillus delphinicola]|nr:hypothetical protein [Actinobacillus delphinicola]MDG6898077.1 hypothetical protein [Actinobacillus delphinicola]
MEIFKLNVAFLGIVAVTYYLTCFVKMKQMLLMVGNFFQALTIFHCFILFVQNHILKQLGLYLILVAYSFISFIHITLFSIYQDIITEWVIVISMYKRRNIFYQNRINFLGLNI